MLALKISVPGQRNVLKGLAVAKVAQGAAQVVLPIADIGRAAFDVRLVPFVDMSRLIE